MQPGQIKIAGNIENQQVTDSDSEFASSGIGEVMVGFDPISLKEMDGVALLNRVDTKYVFTQSQLVQILGELSKDYFILEIEGLRGARYRTEYWDTLDLAFYHHHHNGKKNRTKIRFREYIDSGLRFLEVKNKSNKGRTDKSRIRVEEFEVPLSPRSLEFIHDVAGELPELRPSLVNAFKRLTLVNKNLPERFTIDLQISFEEENGKIDLDGVVIAELKQSKASRNSRASVLLKEMGLRPMSISKYCIGSALLNPGLKTNNFKEKLLFIEKL